MIRDNTWYHMAIFCVFMMVVQFFQGTTTNFSLYMFGVAGFVFASIGHVNLLCTKEPEGERE